MNITVKLKGGIHSHEQKCALFTTARKTNRWPMRLFYGMLDSSLVNAFVISNANNPNFLVKKKDKRIRFMKIVAQSLIEPHARVRLQAKQTPKLVRKIIEGCGITMEVQKQMSKNLVGGNAQFVLDLLIINRAWFA